MTTGTKIRLLREQKGWGQDYIANALGVTQPAISKLESDQTKLSWDTAVVLAGLFEVDPEYFFDSRVNNYNYNHGSGNQVVSPITYNESDIETLKALHAEQLKLKDDLLQERFERNTDLKAQLADLKKELAEVKKQLEILKGERGDLVNG
ncbi:DNA-binding XRE family transcriptional regulator [Arcticibacter tournemirensis]|uniref:Helix-turn-helix transcriptional regulator n=1 Tax=Arcticibacter tournemirensis TaxID=699437 RepID=A0A5M9HAX0_9SPHI|nr:helix-turn-helix transcriptional regulator [Arcticibacter tournemirensis]KAA8482404.1 helix-turn-helix transcriptional regulator [Arcticibacter tournemirensis]TQM51711.1 DNA-binding XRE family transcriptional regulator [Arcticibacter tournemirensis]